jgi:hypothetical protein
MAVRLQRAARAKVAPEIEREILRLVPQKKAVGGEPFAGRTRQTNTVANGCACRAAN